LFLKIKSPKLLLLAGTDRLDKELTIAQMQGKFVFKVLSKVGHVIQEDDPQRTAAVIIDFVERFQL
jgi:protein phosphatase methylesterase 1